MLGAICGDIIGSVFEHENLKSKDFPLFHKESRFTDDTVLTCAVADAIIHGRSFAQNIKKFYHFYPKAGYGYMFSKWANSSENHGYFSFGNGSAMRVSPVAWAFDTLEEVLVQAEASAAVTHNHPEGLKGAKAIAGCVFLARTNHDKDAIRKFAENLGYDLGFTLDEIRETYQFYATCQQSVPQAIVAFLESDDVEDAIRCAISIGGDSDTIACMTGSIAEAFYGGVPQEICGKALELLDGRLRGIFEIFEKQYMG